MRRRRWTAYLFTAAILLALCGGCGAPPGTGASGLWPVEFGADEPAPQGTGEVSPPARREPRVCLAVENILQKPALPNGCEVVSLAIALAYAGYPVDPVELYEYYMPKSPYGTGDPWTAYIGDANGRGLGCYAPCVAATGNGWLEKRGADRWAVDISGRDLSVYERLIDRGIPVILWGTIGMEPDDRVCWETVVGGEPVVWHSYSHCLVLIGYTEASYIFCDPLEGVVEYGREEVERCFAINYRQACAIL